MRLQYSLLPALSLTTIHLRNYQSLILNESRMRSGRVYDSVILYYKQPQILQDSMLCLKTPIFSILQNKRPETPAQMNVSRDPPPPHTSTISTICHSFPLQPVHHQLLPSTTQTRHLLTAQQPIHRARVQSLSMLHPSSWSSQLPRCHLSW